LASQGGLKAFGSTYDVTPSSEEGGNSNISYSFLSGTFSSKTNKVSIAKEALDGSKKGETMYHGTLNISDDGTATIRGTWEARKAQGTFTVKLEPTSDDDQSGLWTGECIPEEGQVDVPHNPITWTIAKRSSAGNEPKFFGAGYFDDAGDIPGQPILKYILREIGDDSTTFQKVYCHPLPSDACVSYTNVTFGVQDGTLSLKGQWLNLFEGTHGVFGACMESPN
jgi:hypothetical protein